MNIKNYKSGEEEIREKLSLDEVIKIIKTRYPFAEYDSNRPHFNAWDQLLVCESIAESHPIKEDKNSNADVNGMINDSCKHKVSFELTPSKQQIITKLNKCNYRTPPIKISQLLEAFLKEWPSDKGWWLYVAQHWTPRAINRTIAYLVKRQTTGQETIKNPAGYFTSLIKYRKKRKIYKYQW